MYCYKCGEDNPDEAKFCKNCGAVLKKEEGTVKKVEVIEAPNYQNNNQQKTTTTTSSTSSSDSSMWIGCCCLGLIVIFIISALFSGI